MNRSLKGSLRNQESLGGISAENPLLKSVAAAFALRMSVRLQAAGERADFSP